MNQPGTVITRTQCGERRCWHSMRIYEHLKQRGLSGQTLAKRIGISREAVCKTITGKYHSLRVLDALRSVGVPEEYLFDPRRVEPAGKEAA